MTSRVYRNGYQSGHKQGYADGWVAALNAVRKSNGHSYYCITCGKALRPDNRLGRHKACINKVVPWTTPLG